MVRKHARPQGKDGLLGVSAVHRIAPISEFSAPCIVIYPPNAPDSYFPITWSAPEYQIGISALEFVFPGRRIPNLEFFHNNWL
ncbi:unnamed protein product [Ectocarpus sp. CCAP 1310/34]|nr:unnamed protein product [Ectocarpus sp. CCAP 1310/34]